MSPRASVALSAFSPMLATMGRHVPQGDAWTFEPKYDGIRLLAFATPGDDGAARRPRDAVHLMTRNGNDRTGQFPEIAAALAALADRAGRPFVLDGEVVAMAGDTPLRFQALQQMHMRVGKGPAGIPLAGATPTTLFVFDILVDGDDVLVREPWTTRRKRLEKLMARRASVRLTLTESFSGDGGKMVARAHAAGWEGVIAKRTDAPYEMGARSRAWIKLKLEHRQEFVVGGFTEPRNSREHLGALLLGYFDGDRFIYAGHTGGGFTRDGLREMGARLKRLERKSCPFETTPRTNEVAHWVRPKVVVEVRFTEWTDDGKLRQPIYLGRRTDKDARDVAREPESVQRAVGGEAPTAAPVRRRSSRPVHSRRGP